MAVTEDVVRLILETKGAETIDKLEKSTAEYKELLALLVEEYTRGEITTEKFLKTQKTWSTQLSKDTGLLEQLRAAQAAQTAAAAAAETQTHELADAVRQESIARKTATAELERSTIAAGKAAAAQDKAEASTAKGAKSTKNYQQASLAASYALQDFTSANGGFVQQLASMNNNLPGIVASLGGPVGLVAGLGALSTVVIAGGPAIISLLDSLNDTKPKPVYDYADAAGVLAARIKELEGKPTKVRIEVEELRNAKQQVDELAKGLAALEAAKSGRTENEKAAGDKFTKEFEGTGKEGKQAVEAVERQVGEAYVARDPAARAARKELAERRRRLAAAEKRFQEAAAAANAPHADETRAALDVQAAAVAEKERNALRDPEAMKKLADDVRQKEENARTAAGSEIGKTMAAVKQGNDPIARDVMANRFREAGQDRFAAMVEGANPQAVAAKKAAELAAQQTADLDKHNAEQSKAGMALLKKKGDEAEQERLRQANDAANALEKDPTVQAELKRNREKFGDHRDIGTPNLDAAAKAAEAKGQLEAAKRDRRELNPQALKAAEEAQRNTAENLNISQAIFQRLQVLEARNRVLEQNARQLNRQVRMPANFNGNPLGGG